MVTIFNLCLGRAIFVLLMTGISFLDRIVIQGFSLIVGLWVGILAGTQFSMEIKIFGHLAKKKNSFTTIYYLYFRSLKNSPGKTNPR